MGSLYVFPVFHARGEAQGNYVCNSRVNSIPSIHKMSCTMAPPKHFTKFPSMDQPLAISGSRAAPIKATQSPSTSSTNHAPESTSNSTKNYGKAPLTLSERWREIQGENHWEGLLDHPINATLRAEIIRYGEFAQVCYDAFDFNQHSLYCGSCKYNRRSLFEKVDKGGCGYEVTKYLYATSKLDLPKFFKKSERDEEGRWSRDSNWIGYVAVCTDEAEVKRIGRRDILIAWRGTVTATEWVDDLMTTQVPANIELAMSRPLNNPFVNAPTSRSQNPLATVKPAYASSRSPSSSVELASDHGPFSDMKLASTSPNTELAACHSRPQDGEGINVKVGNGSGASNTAPYLAAAHKPASAASAAVNEKDVNQDGKAENDVKYNGMQLRHDQPAAICNGDLSEVVKVESGFLSLYSSSKASSRFNKLSAGQQVAMEVKRLLQKYEGEEISITITGHSLGAALALLCAYDIAANVAAPPNIAAQPNTTPITTRVVAAAASEPLVATNPCKSQLNVAKPPEAAAKKGESCPVITVFSFAGPRVGNRALKRRMEELGVRVLRVVNQHDCVPKVPGVLFNEHSPKVWPNTSGYHHVGKELLIDFDLSPHLRHTRDLASHHNLEAHLHVLDGFHGFARPFQSVFGRNPILVNKSSDFLRKEAFIPPSWWQESNKGLIKDPLSGQWVLATREYDHLPEIHHPEVPQSSKRDKI